MKQKVTVQLSERIIERLKAAAARQGATKTAIVEAVLDNFLSSQVDALESVKDGATLRRLNWMSRQLEQLERDLRIVNEVVALHARYHLTVTPPLPSSQQPAACALGLERFEAFAAQVGRRVHLRAPLMRETLDRLCATSPELFARDIEEDAPLGTPAPDPSQDQAQAAALDVEPELCAAAREGGSNAGFPRRCDSRAGRRGVASFGTRRG
jgi:predicted DNA-binding protein